jgi:hypothetical protein
MSRRKGYADNNVHGIPGLCKDTVPFAVGSVRESPRAARFFLLEEVAGILIVEAVQRRARQLPFSNNLDPKLVTGAYPGPSASPRGIMVDVGMVHGVVFDGPKPRRLHIDWQRFEQVLHLVDRDIALVDMAIR